MTNGLFFFNISCIFPKIEVDVASFFIAISFTQKIKIMTAIAPDIRYKRKMALISIKFNIANSTRDPAIAPN